MLTEEQLKRYSRQYIIEEIGLSGQKKLLKSKILVIGAGALGSSALYYLCAAGVGTLGIADFDKVELSNLQRQIIHNTETLGEKKTDSARTSLFRLNPDVKFDLYDMRITENNISDIIKKYDFIVDATDRLATKLMINDSCVKAGKPFVHAGVEKLYGQVTTVIPGKSPCLRCLLGDKAGDETGAVCRFGIVGAVTGIIGSMQALEAIKYITGSGKPLTGSVMFFDGFDMTFDKLPYDKDPECPVCSSVPESNL